MQENETATASEKAPINVYAIGALALISVVGGVIYFNSQTPETPPQPIEIVVPTPTEAIALPPTVEHVDPEPELIDPVTPEIVEALPSTDVQGVSTAPKVEIQPLPTLDNSDELAMNKATQLSWLPSITKQLIQKDLVRNFVTFVDNLSRGDLAAKYSPINKPEQKFSVSNIEKEMYIDSASYKRYDAYVDMMNSINLDMAMNNLTQFMPLFDEAYMELGYEQGTFVTTLSLAIDEMLEAPIIRNPIKLVAPSAMYKYADPQLESLSDVQKLMIRMGPDNMTKLRPKLQQIQLSLSQYIEDNS